MGYSQNRAFRLALCDFIEKPLQPGHLLKKRLTIYRLDPHRLRTHQIVENFHRLAVEAGMAFVEAGVDGQRKLTARQDNRGGLPCARELRGA